MQLVDRYYYTVISSMHISCREENYSSHGGLHFPLEDQQPSELITTVQRHLLLSNCTAFMQSTGEVRKLLTVPEK